MATHVPHVPHVPHATLSPLPSTSATIPPPADSEGADTDDTRKIVVLWLNGRVYVLDDKGMPLVSTSYDAESPRV